MAGRKKYVPTDKDIANVELWASEGFNKGEIAKKLKISRNTFDRNSGDFGEPFKKGKERSDKYRVEKVEEALFKRATGFEGPDGKYYPPSDTAAIFFLANRAPVRWRSINKDREDDRAPRTVDFTFKVVNADSA